MPLTDECELPLISGQSQHAVLVDRALRRLGAILRRSSTIALAGGTRTLTADEAASRLLKFTGTPSIVVLGRAGEWAVRNGTGGVVTVKAGGADAGVAVAAGDTVQVVSDGGTAFGLALAEGSVSWNSIGGKPTEFPPSAHGHPQPSARVFNNASVSIPNNVHTAIAFNSERWDTTGFHNAINPSRLTAPVAGVYSMVANVAWAAGGGARRLVSIRLNGETFISIDERAPSTLQVWQAVPGIWQMNAGEYAEVVVLQDSGAALNVLFGVGSLTPELSMIRVSE